MIEQLVSRDWDTQWMIFKNGSSKRALRLQDSIKNRTDRIHFKQFLMAVDSAASQHLSASRTTIILFSIFNK